MIRAILFFLFPLFAFGQPPSDRYTSELFDVVETSGVVFSAAVPQPNPGGGFYEFITGYPLNVDEYDVSPVDLKMDIFQPVGDTLSQRPLVIVAFGGGFLSGSRDHWSIRLICQDLARRGFVAAAIDYRLGMNIFDSDLAMRAVYRGVQDTRSAVRFFRADAAGDNTYRIAPDHIYIGGHSSGGFGGLHNAYLDKELERPISTYEWVQDGQFLEDQTCVDCIGDNLGFDGRANAVFSLAGALGFTDFIETAEDPSLVMFHSEDDDTVPYDSGGPFSSLLWLVVGSDLPDVYGSLPISIQADAVGLPYEFYSYASRGHSVHEDGSSGLYADIVPGISDWFFHQEMKPQFDGLLGDSIICSDNLEESYHLFNMSQGHYYDWSAVGGAIDFSPADEFANVDWDDTENVHKIAVVPYSMLDAAGDMTSLEVSVLDANVNTFTNGNDWMLDSNWDLGFTPTVCSDVVIPIQSTALDLQILSDVYINSLNIGANVTLEIGGNLYANQRNELATNPSLSVDGLIINNGQLIIGQNDSNQGMIISSGELINNGVLEVVRF